MVSFSRLLFILFCFGYVFAAYSQSNVPSYVPTNGLVGWWPFNGNANDESGNGNNGTVYGATLSTDRVGNSNSSYSFNGISNYIAVPNIAVQGANSRTISFWIKTNSTIYGSMIVSTGTNADVNGGAFNLRLENTNRFIGFMGGNYTLSGYDYYPNGNIVLNNNIWHNVLVTYNGTTINFYIDGVFEKSTNKTLSTNGQANFFGKSNDWRTNNAAWYSGQIDDVGTWNRVLSQSEITALYQANEVFKAVSGSSVTCAGQPVTLSIDALSGTINGLTCSSASNTGTLIAGIAANGVSSSVPYSSGNGGMHNGQTVSSTGVTGLTATLNAGIFTTGAGSLTYNISGTPSASGTASFTINVGGQTCTISINVLSATSPTYPANSVFCANGPTTVVDVTNPTTGKTWMDRNLGATQVATSSTDVNAYGDLYQWGRRSDGHQCRTSATTSTLSSTDQPAHGNFILAPNSPNDWRSPQNTNLWQGINGINNPCPNAYRLPTETELNSEKNSWSSSNSTGAINSQLKLPMSGARQPGGNFYLVDTRGYLWTSNINGTNSRNLDFYSISGFNSSTRANAIAVRCIKETSGSIGALNCGSATVSGNLISGAAASGVSASIPYTGGNGGFFASQSISSTGVLGLTASISQGLFASGAGNLIYTISGTPSASGTASFVISIGGQSCTLSIVVYGDQPAYPTGSVFCNGITTIVNDVTNPTTGKTWMDRNLGASQVASSGTDANAYGDLYQWGRRSDGHQCRNSATTTTLSSTDQPAHGKFILAPNSPYDWRSPQNTNLWQGINGINNPCPSGYRLPTATELGDEQLSWGGSSSLNSINSGLKLPLAGHRIAISGLIELVGTGSRYWSSTYSSTNSTFLIVDASVSLTSYFRAGGRSVRCIKEIVGSIGALNCGSSTLTGNLISGTAASGVSVSVPYTGGNAGYYPSQNISSTDVTGLTASISQGLFASGAGNLVYTISGTPIASGTASFALNIGGQNCSLSINVLSATSPTHPANSVFCANGPTTVVDVTNPTTGKTWMDRNLGASQVATSSTDANSFGDLYQWGRRSDGHQCRNSLTSTTISSSDQPLNSNFVLDNSYPIDWRNPQNNNLWQGINGINNPCPSGYRIPTESELNNERLSWSLNNSNGAFNSPLKLPMTGIRSPYNGSLLNVGGYGFYWSSTVSGEDILDLRFDSTGEAFMGYGNRAMGEPVRCIKN